MIELTSKSRRSGLLLLTALLSTALLSGCLDIGLPFVLSTDPYYAADDPGVALPEHVFEGGWMSDDKHQLKIEPDALAGRPGDYILTFTNSMPSEPVPDEPSAYTARDSSQPANNTMLQVHVFEIDGQTYADITTLQLPAEPMPDEPTTRGRKGHDGHILARMEVGLNQVGFQLMDQQWFNEYTAAHKGELGLTYPEPLPNAPNNPMIRASHEQIAAFLKAHANDGLWGPAIRFNRQQ